MNLFTVTFLPDHVTVTVTGGTVLDAQRKANLHPDAPCGGRGTCGKCKVSIDGAEMLACQTLVDRDMTVYIAQRNSTQILCAGKTLSIRPDGEFSHVMAMDIGTTTVVAYLLDGKTGEQLATASCLNPQGQYGADVISRIQYSLNTDPQALSSCIRGTLQELADKLSENAGIGLSQIGAAAIVGNTAMHHLLLGIDPRPLVTPPYMPSVRSAIRRKDSCDVRILPNIAGFVGADTVGCLVSTRFDTLDALTLLIDIGTNGEMVLGNSRRRIACSTAAGPAFEGARISCGMRGAQGAVDHVWLEDGHIRFHVIGEAEPIGLCGSGLLDLVAVLLETGQLDESGRLEGKSFSLCDSVTLTQKDVREVQLAKAAIRAGIELLAEQFGTDLADIRQVFLAGAFGSFMDPASACRIGMIPPVLEDRITAIGNAAGEGAKLCALSQEEFAYSQQLAANTEFLELASLPQFQDRYIDALEFEEEAE